MENHDVDELGDLVVECLDRMERSGLGAIEELCRERPEHAAALRSRMSTLAGTGLLEADADIPERLGDFRLRRRLGAGGMGIVYAALQESLGREVALKLVRPDQLFFPGARERFRREVEVVAHLQHPGIVPVYTVGEEHGIPYFTMELQHGATLAEVLAECQGKLPHSGQELADALSRAVQRRNGEPPTLSGALFEGAWVDACVQMMREVALALDFAHRQNVLHRDLKPSNVMLTTNGRALLFDFGLASAPDSPRVTRTGSRVGSLAYMAPEQLRGDALDVQTDIYGLGAMLCELLTLSPPHGDLRGDPLTRAILQGDAVDIRAANRDVSRDLNTVCHKALEPEPTRRYPSAALMARDLEHVLARRPVEARRAGPLSRAARWAQRHPARALALVLAIGAPLALAVQRDRSSHRIEEQRDRAQSNLDQALRALDVFLFEVGDSSLEGIPRMEATRLRLLEEALALFEELMPQQPNEPEMRRRWADMQGSMGEVLAMLGRLPEAELCFVNQLSVLGEHRTPDAEQSEQLASCLNSLANAFFGQGRNTEAIEAYERARDLLRSATDPLGLDRLSTVQRNLGHALDRMGRATQADQAFAAAAVAADLLRQADGGSANARSQLGNALLGRAILRSRTGDSSQARELLRRATPILLERARESPEDPEALHAAALVCMNAGGLEPPEDAEPLLRAGLSLSEQLVKDFPATPEYARTLSGLSQNLGLTLRAQGRWAEVEPLLLRGMQAVESAAHRFPDVLENQSVLGRSALNLASFLVQVERRAEACEPGQVARLAFAHALELQPGDAGIGAQLAWASIQEAYGRIARKQLEQAESLLTPLAELAPDDPGVFVSMAEILSLCMSLDESRAAEFERRALDALEHGLALGFPDLDYVRGSVELRNIAQTGRFISILSHAEPDPQP